MTELFPLLGLLALLGGVCQVLGPLLRRPRRGAASGVAATREPSVAVLLPLHGDGEGLASTLHSLLAQDYPAGKLRVVVVADGASGAGLARARRLAAQQPRVTLLRAPPAPGAHRGLAHAVQAVGAEVLLRVPPDVTVDRRAVRALVRHLAPPRVAAVGGRTFLAHAHPGWLLRRVELACVLAEEWLGALGRSLRPEAALPAGLIAYRRAALLGLASPPAADGEERLLLQHLVRAGDRVAFTGAAFCQRAAAGGLSEHVSQLLRRQRRLLLDALGGLLHAAWHRPLHGLLGAAQLAVLLAAPVLLVQALAEEALLDVVLLHLAVMGALGALARARAEGLPEQLRLGARHVLPVALLMPLAWALFLPLALLAPEPDVPEGGGSSGAEPAPLADEEGAQGAQPAPDALVPQATGTQGRGA